MDDHDRLTTLRALAHPARLQILSLLTGTTMSAAEVAREIGTTQANASYHLRRLAIAGEVEIAEELTIRGGRARRYRSTSRDVEPATPPPDDGGGDAAEQAFFAAMAGELQRRVRARRRDGRSVNIDAELWLPPEVWDDLVARMTAIGRELHAQAVPPRTPGAVRANTTLAAFTMDPDARPLSPEDEP